MHLPTAQQGHVYLVGAGPGDASLITVRGLALLGSAEVVVHDYLVAGELLEETRADAERVYVGKRHGHHSISQAEVERVLIDRARQGKSVVRLKGGDPFVFGRGGEEAVALAEADVPFEVVPGVTAGLGATACSGMPVTYRAIASSVTLCTGHESPDKETSGLDYRALVAIRGTLVFYMGVSNLSRICSRLIEAGLDPATPAATIRWGCTRQQEVLTGTAATLPDLAQAANLRPPAVIVIGQIVRLRDLVAELARVQK